jgi:predicted nucleotidyltransferase
VKLAYLFGSAAAGNATPLSDIDVALVLPDDQVDPGSFLSLEMQISDEISRNCELSEVDVRIINNAPLMFQGEVITHGILL